MVRYLAFGFILSSCLGDVPRVEVGESTATVTQGNGHLQSERFALLDETESTLLSNGMELIELSRISSPLVAGTHVQATDVLIRDHLVFATYNTAGDVFSGALQIFDATDPEQPTLLMEARFSQSEANRVQVQGDYIYVAGGDLTLAATLDTFFFDGSTLEHRSTLQLPGFQTTMLQINGQLGLATSGTFGGVTVLDLSDPSAPAITDTLPIDDARFVMELNPGELIVLSGGESASLTRYDIPATPGNWVATATASVDGVTVGAPSWGNLIGNDLYISADVGGVATFSLESGGIAPQGIIPTTGDANGLAPTPDQRIAILANGQEGLIAIDTRSAANAEQLASFDVPDDSGSANAIHIQHDLIAMADGLGGIKLFTYNINQVGSRLVTILMTFSNPGIPTEVAATLAKQAVNWTSPRTPSRVLVVRDDSHNGEFSTDTQFVVDLLRDQGYDATYMDEPEDGLTPADIAGYDVIWFANPGWPLDDRATYDTLVTFSQEGGGVIFQGDDMSWSKNNAFDLSPLTYLENIDNGTTFCGVTINNNNGNNYRVTFEDTDHPVIDGLQGQSFLYGDDIDHSIALNMGEEVLAWATLDSDDVNCDKRSPVVVSFGPERAAQLQGL